MRISCDPGANAVGVILGNGMYNVAGGRYVKFTDSIGRPKFILHLRIEYDDGTTQVVVSDDHWKAAASPIRFSCIYGGEDYDARREQPGWNEPGFAERAGKRPRPWTIPRSTCFPNPSHPSK